MIPKEGVAVVDLQEGQGVLVGNFSGPSLRGHIHLCSLKVISFGIPPTWLL